MNGIERNVWLISCEAKERTDRRYIAKYYTAAHPMWGKLSWKQWGVFDQKVGRYLTNAEVEALTTVEIREGL